MLCKVFEDMIGQMKTASSSAIGIIDSNGSLVAMTEGELEDEFLEKIVDTCTDVNKTYMLDGYTLIPIGNKNHPEHIVFVKGTNATSHSICSLMSISVQNIKLFYDEKYDKANFIKNVIFSNLLPSELYSKARELNVDVNTRRAVFLINSSENNAHNIAEILSSLFPEREKDVVLTISDNDVVLVRDIRIFTQYADLRKVANTIIDTVESETMTSVLLAIGSVADNLSFLSTAFKDAQVAIEVGKVFETEKNILCYNDMGIGRLIYQLPTRLCELFLDEVFKKGSIDDLDDETLWTANKFFENDLNISETSRKLYVHRNTLVYRLDKINKLTGLDLRKFDQAIVFKVAIMVHKYLSKNSSNL